MIPNHVGGPAFTPLIYDGEEYERNPDDGLSLHDRLPAGVSLDGYFDYSQPIVVSRPKQTPVTNNSSNKNKKHDPRGVIQAVRTNNGQVSVGVAAGYGNDAGKTDRQRGAKGWNDNTQAPTTFDGLKKREVFGRPQPSVAAREQPAVKVLPKKVLLPSDRDLGFKDIAQIEEVLAKQNSHTVRAVVQTQELKLKFLEEQLKKEQQAHEANNKAYGDKIADIMRQQKGKNDGYLRKLKAANDEILQNQGFQVRPAQPKSIKTQQKNLRSGSAQKKKPNKNQARRSTSGRSRSPNYSVKNYPTSLEVAQFRAPVDPHVFNPMETFQTGGTRQSEWAQQLEDLKEGYENSLKPGAKRRAAAIRPSEPQEERFSERPTRQVGNEDFEFYRPETADLEIDDHPAVEPSTRRQARPQQQKLQPKTADLASLEQQLQQVRKQLQPVVNSLRNEPAVPRLGPTAELVASSVGRLMKIHSEKLLEMVLDDMVVEMIAILNHKEEVQKRMEIDGDLQAMALAMCEELNKIDIDQRVLINGPILNPREQAQPHKLSQIRTFGPSGGQQPFLSHSLNSPADMWNGLAGPNHALEFVHGSQAELLSSNLPRDLQKDRPFEIYNKVKGPLSYTAGPVRLSLPVDQIVSVAANKCVNDVSVEAVKYLRKPNVQAYQKAIDQVIDGVLDQIFREFEEAQEEFVAEVVQQEFPSSTGL